MTILTLPEAVVYAVIICAFGVVLGLFLGMARPQILDALARLIDPPAPPEPLAVVLKRLTEQR